MLGPTPLSADTAIPEWARPRWELFARTHSLKLSTRISPGLLAGDFDGDGKVDVALFVEGIKSHKNGIVFLHRSSTGAYLVGAGTPLGNGGDDFEWMDSWSVKRHGATTRSDAILAMRESSASGLIYFEKNRYHWKQQGD